MLSKGSMVFICLVVIFATGDGAQDQFTPTNYDISRNYKLGFGIRDIIDYVLGGGGYGYPGNGYYPNNNYNQYPGNQGPGLYPSGPGNYPGNYPGNNYPVHQGPPGPPGAHPGCPLCDSSVYSYCSQKQAHDSCCCDDPAYLGYHCRKADCKFLYANSCQEYNLISNCCCVDVQKSAGSAGAPLAGRVGGPLAVVAPVALAPVPVAPVVG